MALIDIVYPVGVVIGVDNDDTPAFTKYGTWEKIAASRILQGADDTHKAGTEIEAGLPNITGYFYGNQNEHYSKDNGGGAFLREKQNSDSKGGTGHDMALSKFTFDAARCSEIYGASDTVQPPAHVVQFWKRVK